MTHTRDNVIAAVRTLFPDRDVTQILAVVDLYGTAPHEPEVERVRLAIVELSEGDEEGLKYLVQVAKVDYRDVLAWKQLGPLSPAQGEKLQSEVRGLLDKWREK